MKLTKEATEALDRLPSIEARLAKGQQFNLYEAGTGWAVCLGPVTNCVSLAEAYNEAAGELIVQALRAATAGLSAITKEDGHG